MMMIRLCVAALALTAGLLPATAQAQAIRIVALGDSNTAGFGFGVGRASAFPALLQSTLRASGYDVSVANQGITGDTTAGMLARLDQAVPQGTSIAIVQGGYNDRRRVAPETTAANVDAILARLKARGVRVILCGLDGADWSRIARRRGAILVPGSTCYDENSRGFDGLHMSAQGHVVVAARLAPVVKRLVGRR